MKAEIARLIAERRAVLSSSPCLWCSGPLPADMHPPGCCGAPCWHRWTRKLIEREETRKAEEAWLRMFGTRDRRSHP